MLKRYNLQFLLITILSCYIYLVFITSTIIIEIDYASFFFEGILISMPLTGIFLIDRIKDNDYKTFKFIFTGLSFLCISMTTDTIDEIIEISNIQDIVFEGFFEVLGFLFLTLGLNSWTKYNSEINNNLNKIAGTDYLTGICNRRSFMSILSDNITLSKNKNSDLSLILLDIDNFKKINDKYGHDIGDIVLLKISSLVSKNIRVDDIVARYGGEEFVILLPNTKLQNAQTLADKLCKLIAQSNEIHMEKVTASFGLTQYQKDDDIDSFLKRADSAMYEAKGNGKNQVVTTSI